MALTTVQKLQNSDFGVFLGLLTIGGFGIAFLLGTMFGISHLFGEATLSNLGGIVAVSLSPFVGIAVGFLTYRRVLYGK